MTSSPRPIAVARKSVLGFPVTPYTASGETDLDLYEEIIEILLSFGAKALFPGCGTGEMQSLSLEEHRSLVARCVSRTNGRAPVFAGVGFGVAIARQMTRTAAEVGADGVLVFPPYLSSADSESLFQYYASIAAAASIGVIVYQRDGIKVSPDTLARLSRIENVIGFKDGTGQVDLLQRQVAAVDRSPFTFFNGTPTAELFVPAMARCGIESYSSALLNVMPEFAIRFNAAFNAGDETAMQQLIRSVVLPFVRLRDRAPGYAVSLIKAGARLRGLPVGRVRPPLPEPSRTDVNDLEILLERLGLEHPLKPRSPESARVWSMPRSLPMRPDGRGPQEASSVTGGRVAHDH